MPSHFYRRVCRKNVSVLTHGHHGVLRQFQGSRHFARDQRLRLETPGCRVLDFHENPLSEDELERQREEIRTSPLVLRDHEHPFAEDLITEEAGVVASSDKGVLLGRRAEDGRQQWTSREAVGADCANRRASEYRSSLDTRRSFGRFRRFPEPLRLIPDSLCCFAFSLS